MKEINYIIIDNNILFSLMKPNSCTSKLLNFLDCNLLAPEFIFREFKRHELECLRKSGLPRKIFDLRKKEVFSKIKFINFCEYRNFINKFAEISLDPDDAPYLALALKLNVPIWSNDRDLKKQDKIIILSTKEIVDLMC